MDTNKHVFSFPLKSINALQFNHHLANRVPDSLVNRLTNASDLSDLIHMRNLLWLELGIELNLLLHPVQNGSITLLFVILDHLVLLFSKVDSQILVKLEDALCCDKDWPGVKLVEEHQHLDLSGLLNHRIPDFFLLIGYHNAINNEVIFEAAAVISAQEKLRVVVKSCIQQLPGSLLFLAVVVK